MGQLELTDDDRPDNATGVATPNREIRNDPSSLPAEHSRRSFARTYCATLAVTYLAVILVNWIGNGSGCFVSSWCPSVTDRAWKTRRLEWVVRSEGPPQVLILGSSRLMQIKPAQVQAITGKRCFNYCIIGSNILDYLTQLRYVLAIGAKPETIILDLRQFDGEVSSFNAQLAAHAELFASVPFPDNLIVAGKMVQSINLRFTLASVRNMIRVLVHRGVRHDGEFLEDDEVVILPDGYRLNRARTQAKASGKSDLAAKIALWALTQAGNAAERERDFPPLNDWWLAYYRDLLRLAQSVGVRVYIIVTPVQPKYESMLSNAERKYLHEDLPRILKTECDRYGAEFRDFSRLESFAGDADEFWDVVHQTPENMRRMTNSLFGVAPKKTFAGVATDLELLRGLGKTPPPDNRTQPTTE